MPAVTRGWLTGKPDFGVGTTWKCDDCDRVWELTFVPARGTKGKWKEIAAQGGQEITVTAG